MLYKVNYYVSVDSKSTIKNILDVWYTQVSIEKIPQALFETLKNKDEKKYKCLPTITSIESIEGHL